MKKNTELPNFDYLLNNQDQRKEDIKRSLLEFRTALHNLEELTKHYNRSEIEEISANLGYELNDTLDKLWQDTAQISTYYCLLAYFSKNSR